MPKPQLIVWSLALLGAVAAAQAPVPPSSALAIVNVTVIDTESGTAQPGRTVVMRDGRIVSIDRAAAPAGMDVVDGRGKFLMPGLWDMHVHLSYARASALPLLVANGVTGVRDMGGDLAEIDRWRGEIAAGTVVGPSIVRAGPILNGREFNAYQLAIANAADARTAVRTLQKAGVDLIKTHRQTSREAYFAAADEARTLGLPFGSHVPVTVTPDEAADARPTTIEHTVTLFEGTFAAAAAGQDLPAAIGRWKGTPEASALFAKFARHGIVIDPTLVALEYVTRIIETGQPDPLARYIAASARRQAEPEMAAAWKDAAKYLRERKPFVAELRAVTGLMHRAGVRLVNGTDTSFFMMPPGFVVHDELAYLVEAGLAPADVLRIATVNSAGLFPAQNAGVIAAGKRADAVLLDANPLDDIHNTRRIGAVILRGKYLNRQALDGLLRDAARLANVS